MPGTEPRLPSEEIVRRGKEIYERIRAQVEPGNKGKVLAIDVESGEFEIGPDVISATDGLFARLPDPQIYSVRIGYPTLYRLGRVRMKSAS